MGLTPQLTKTLDFEVLFTRTRANNEAVPRGHTETRGHNETRGHTETRGHNETRGHTETTKEVVPARTHPSYRYAKC